MLLLYRVPVVFRRLSVWAPPAPQQIFRARCACSQRGTPRLLGGTSLRQYITENLELKHKKAGVAGRSAADRHVKKSSSHRPDKEVEEAEKMKSGRMKPELDISSTGTERKEP